MTRLILAAYITDLASQWIGTGERGALSSRGGRYCSRLLVASSALADQARRLFVCFGAIEDPAPITLFSARSKRARPCNSRAVIQGSGL